MPPCIFGLQMKITRARPHLQSLPGLMGPTEKERRANQDGVHNRRALHWR